MAMENHKDRGLGQLYLLGTLVIAVLVLGTWGWLEADPTLHWCDALYRAFQLFTLDMPEQNPPLTLEVARWLALIVAFYTVAKVLRTVFTRQKQLLHARLRRNHGVAGRQRHLPQGRYEGRGGRRPRPLRPGLAGG